MGSTSAQKVAGSNLSYIYEGQLLVPILACSFDEWFWFKVSGLGGGRTGNGRVPREDHPTQEAVQKICRHHLQRPSGLGKTNGTAVSRPHPSKPLAPVAFAMRRMTDSANPLGTADSADTCGLDIHRRMRRLMEPWKQRALFGATCRQSVRHMEATLAMSCCYL